MSVTVIMTSWRRHENLASIAKAWLEQPECSELILWDNSGDTSPAYASAMANAVTEVEEMGAWVIRSTQNYGSSARYALAALAKNEILMFGDDDVLPLPGLLNELLEVWDEDPQRMVGVRGRNWMGPEYEHHIDIYSGDLDKPFEVDMLVGYIMLCHRDLILGFNFSQAAHYCCELELFGRIRERMGAFPDLQLVVSTSTSFEQLPEGEDPKTALYLQSGANAEKREVWERHYKNKINRRVHPK